jgi:hypothetical protein
MNYYLDSKLRSLVSKKFTLLLQSATPAALERRGSAATFSAFDARVFQSIGDPANARS